MKVTVKKEYGNTYRVIVNGQYTKYWVINGDTVRIPTRKEMIAYNKKQGRRLTKGDCIKTLEDLKPHKDLEVVVYHGMATGYTTKIEINVTGEYNTHNHGTLNTYEIPRNGLYMCCKGDADYPGWIVGYKLKK